MKNIIKHLKIIHIHRKYVRNACFKMGLFWQGVMHDLSKYSPAELSIAKYYSDTRSPHQNARDILGYSPSWIHHYHLNKHHHQFWYDDSEDGQIIPMKMPYKYVVESFCDMLGASKAYHKNNWHTGMVLDYWNTKCTGKRIMHPASTELTDMLIKQLDKLGEETFFEWYVTQKPALQANYDKK